MLSQYQAGIERENLRAIPETIAVARSCMPMLGKDVQTMVTVDLGGMLITV